MGGGTSGGERREAPLLIDRSRTMELQIKIIWICMLHKRSAESAKSKMPVFSRRILGSAKARKDGSYLSSLI